MSTKNKNNDSGRKSHSIKMTGRTKQTHEGLKIISTKMSKYFNIKSPCGVEYNGLNLSEFCKEHQLDQGAMSKVCRGDARHHKGWTGSYIKD